MNQKLKRLKLSFLFLILCPALWADEHESFKDKAEALTPDLSLLKARTISEHRKLGGRAPYFRHYKKRDIELVFVAARHEPRAGSPTHKLIQEVTNTETIGPILLGLNKPYHVLQMGSSVREIVNMIKIAVVDAQTRK